MSFFAKIFKRGELSTIDKKWNHFISKIYEEDFNLDSLNTGKRKLALCIYYDDAVCGGGHSAFFERYSKLDNEELISALKEIGNKKIADNFKEALEIGERDEYVHVDDTYYSFEPDLFYFIQEYFESNLDIF